MGRKMILGMVLAFGALAATQVRAQETTGATESNAPDSSATSQGDGYGAYIDGPATVDADGVPVRKPNAMSDFMKESRSFNLSIEQPLVSDTRTDASGTDGQTK